MAGSQGDAKGGIEEAGTSPALSVDLRAFGLADALRWIHESRRSGLLRFASDDVQKRVYFARGEVVFATSNRKADRLGAALHRAGALTAEQLATAEDRFRDGTRFGRIVVELGYLSPRELWSGVKFQVEEIVRSLLGFDAGRVDFFEGEFEPDNVVRLSLRTHRLVEEGLAAASRREEHARAEEAEVRALVDAYAKLVFELAAPLIALDGPGPVASRLNHILEESAVAGGGLLDALRLAPNATLDPARLTEEAVALDGDRVTAVEEPLSEIVAYLEFELKNHPRIEEADAFLEAVEPLRAMLRR